MIALKSSPGRGRRPASDFTLPDVSGVRDPEERNRLITRSYGQLSRRMRDVLGADAGINWCTLAAWASHRVGRTLRREDSNAFLAGAAKLVTLGDLDHGRARAAVAEGNLRVFAEIAPVFARFIDWFGRGLAVDAARLDLFLDTLRPGRTEDRDAAGRPGQGLLRDAFRNYFLARCGAGDVKERQELTFLANVQAALHEQIHLQDVIARAMPKAGWLRRAVTSTFMDLPLPRGRSVRLGRDVPGDVAPYLRCIDHPKARELLRQFGVGKDACGSGCSDWSDLGQRMRFIIALLLVRQADAEMFEMPELEI